MVQFARIAWIYHVIQVKREYDEGNIEKDEGITF